MRWYETVSAPWNQIEPERCRSVLIQRASQLVSSREEMCKIRFVGTHERGHGYKYVCTPWSGALFVCPLVQFLWYCLSIVNVLTHIASPPSQLYSQHYITIGSITEWTYSRGPHEMNNLRKNHTDIIPVWKRKERYCTSEEFDTNSVEIIDGTQ